MATLTNFIKFHLGLVMDNSTTIENLDNGETVGGKRRQSTSSSSSSSRLSKRSKYDIGRRRNIEQVMGSSVVWWFIPHHNVKSRPVGDGVSWVIEDNKEDSVIEMMTSSTKHL
ncbi:hypothetical protein FOL47_005950 [Perkinsus chesapeaki]|uniref:Uncharacterized protein n=1 Tax=Perkinsus chesapeaki TaxID=330153 RepID=A0A7J6MYM8_PERCH|nr:hypothetical protein FOL47_005950 [Perkinsus chesapeaki]